VLGEDDSTRRWCQEARTLLRLARTVAPHEDDEGLVEAESVDTSDAALLLKKSFQLRFAADPDGASKAQSARLSVIRSRFSNTYSGHADKGRLKLIQVVFSDMVKAMQEEQRECALRHDLITKLQALAPAKASGAALVAGATEADTTTLKSRRDAMTEALERASSLDALNAEQASLEAVARERDAVELKVEARTQQAERITAEAALLKAAPEAPAGSLVAQHEAVAEQLEPPLSDEALVKAEAALVKLRSDWELVEAEAKALQEMRAVFAEEARVLRQEVEALGRQLGQKQKTLTESLQLIITGIATAVTWLDVAAGRVQTEKFPAELGRQKAAVIDVIPGLTGTGNQQVAAKANSYLLEELERLIEAAAQLPTPDHVAKENAKTVNKALDDTRKLLKAGSAAKTKQAVPEVKRCSGLIDAWRASAGATGIVLGQRKALVEKGLKPANPTGADPAFALDLDALRKRATGRLVEPLVEVNIAEAEKQAGLFKALWKKATDDAAAAARVATAVITLDTELANVSDAARPAAQTELAKAKAVADQRLLLAGTDRDMPQTAKVHLALVARMQEIAAEGSFAGTPKAPFADLDEGVRELAFTVCGPALITGMDKKAKEALSAVLVSDGPAIQLLAEGPLGGNPKVFAKVLAGCGAGGLAALARALDGEGGKGARAALEGLVDKAGLGGNPELISRLLGEPPKTGDSPEISLAKQQAQARNAAGLKSLAENFSGEEGRAAMSALMVEGGLAASDGALASLMQEGGFAGDGAKLRAFADAFVGDAEGLKRIVSTAGVAEHPAVLGPLAKRAGAPGVKSIATAFDKPEDCARLKGLLDGGGMGGDTSLPGKRHEHPDTLTKVFVDGLGGKGEKLKAYAKAFGGPDGPADSKRMLDGFNEYGDVHKDHRQPGKGIALLLGGQQLKGTPDQRITKLATQFVPKIKAIPEGPQRNRAIRMAPHMGVDQAQEGWKPKSPAMGAQDIDRVTASVLKRHQPEKFDLSKVNDVQSMFAPGTDVGDLFDQAMAAITADRDDKQTVNVTARPPPTVIAVEVGFLDDRTVNHFGPRQPVGAPHPQETPLFTRSEIENIFKAIK